MLHITLEEAFLYRPSVTFFTFSAIFLLHFGSIANERNLDLELRAILAQEGIQPQSFTPDISSPQVKLGSMLFADVRLSGSKNISCMTCHHPLLGTSDQLPLSIGTGGQGEGRAREMGSGHIVARNSPSLWNLALLNPNKMFWDGRVSYDPVKKIFSTPEERLNGENPQNKHFTNILSSALSAQVLFPVINRDEMLGAKGSNEVAHLEDSFEILEKITQRILAVSQYVDLLKQIYPNTPLKDFNFAHLAEAIAAFEKNFFTRLNSPFDQYVGGDNSAMNESEKRGAILFYSSAKCFMCHKGLLQTDQKFHNTGFPQIGPGQDESRDDKGLYLVTQNTEDLYTFKTPSLRNLALTAPYGHSGSINTIEDVVLHYTHPMRSNHHYEQTDTHLPYELELQTQNMNDRLRRVDALIGRMGIFISPEDQSDLVQFLKSGLLSL